MYNFLDPKLRPKVSTTAAALDDYEASNLLSENVLVKSRGFIAYTSIKPPIDIDFELICPISLHYISISTKIGTQKSSAIEIFAKNSNTDFTSIAHSYFDEDGIVFCNSRYYSKRNPPKNVNLSFNLTFFKHNLFRIFINASFIKIRILRTERSVPCIGSIQIWGVISKSCSSKQYEEFSKIFQKESVLKKQILEENKASDSFEIPEDFKDAITFEIMAMPMTLPSGHTIDQTTIEKCTQNDAIYGRPGCDPFTGLPFIENRKPKLNAALKSRIDMFLLQNAHRKETFGVSRTIGRKRPLQPDFEKVSFSSSKVIKSLVSPDNNSRKVESLDEAILKAMSNEGFVCFTRNEEVKVKEVNNECFTCKSSDNLYVLLCKHLYCRKCLMDVCKKLVCDVCNKRFCRPDVKKFHI